MAYKHKNLMLNEILAAPCIQ